ncbi:VOC family protein [Streptomyces glaucosporus]|uniref:VOC family protein n=1 Tax=Streptomyces glaucosporus TaxID=284044 RepID=A0ABP5UWY9_9ACTN
MILRHVTIDCVEPYELARFWSELTGWPISDEDEPGDDEVLVEAPRPVPALLFIRVPEGKTVKNRVHFDWMPTDRTRDEEVERATVLGARVHEDHRVPDGRGWVTLLDPEGNEFCVERSEAERAGRTPGTAPGVTGA